MAKVEEIFQRGNDSCQYLSVFYGRMRLERYSFFI